MQEPEQLEYGTEPKGHGAEMAFLLACFMAITFVILMAMIAGLWLLDKL